MIPYGRQEIEQSDIDAVIKVLNSEFLTQGPAVPKFEAAISSYTGAKHCVAMTSATSALHAACMALGVGPGDVVWTSPISFVASANCAIYCGAGVDFVDVDPLTGNMSLIALESKLLDAVKTNSLPKVVIPVHFAGQPVNMREIARLSTEYNFRVIEDASHALGSKFAERLTGSCAWSDITVFSFHPVKMITTGEGGAATTNDEETNLRLQRIRSHGITRDPNSMKVPFEGDWHYDQIELGYNYRMTDIYAALGESQLKRLSQFLHRRSEIAETYDLLLQDTEFTGLNRDPEAVSSWHLYVALVSGEVERKRLFDTLRQQGVLVNVHYRPIYRQSFYAEHGSFSPEKFPGAEEFYSRAISLPIFPSLRIEDQRRVVDLLLNGPGYQALF